MAGTDTDNTLGICPVRPATKPVSWPLASDVSPADGRKRLRSSWRGCFERPGSGTGSAG